MESSRKMRPKDVVPLREGGPDWTGDDLDLDECSDAFRVFDFAWKEAPSAKTLLSEADDKEGVPILCYSGNFVPTWTAAEIRKRLGVREDVGLVRGSGLVDVHRAANSVGWQEASLRRRVGPFPRLVAAFGSASSGPRMRILETQ